MFLKFEWNNNILFYKIENGKLQKGKMDNEYESYDLTLEEENVLESVLSKIVKSNNTLRLKNIEFNQKTFAHLINENNYNLFYEIKDNNYSIPVENDLIILNNLYNAQEEYWAFEESKKEKDYFKRIINYGKKALVVFVTSNLALGLSGQIIVNAQVGDYQTYYQENIVEQETEKENIQLTYQDVVNLVNHNSNLSQKEKELILSNPKYFEDNLKYMDNSHVSKMLKNLKVEYNPNSNGKIQGSFYDSSYKVIVYNAHNFDDASKSTLTHEFSHAFAIPPLSYGKVDYSQKIIEALNVIVNNEYFGHDPVYDSSYNNVTPYARILAEIVDPEILKQAFFKTDFSIIENYLKNIINDDAYVKDLFMTINANFSINDELIQNYNLDDKERQNLLDLSQQNNQLILDHLKQLYETKTNDSIMNNEEIMYWYDKSSLLKDIVSPYFNNEVFRDLSINNYTNIKVNKTYFNDTCPNSIINICNKINPTNYPLGNLDKKIYMQDGVIKEENGKYIINEDYRNQFIISGNQIYQKGYEPAEYTEYQLQSVSLNYKK